MRIVLFGGFVDYQIQLANALSEKEEVMCILEARSLPDEFVGIIDKKVAFHLFRGGSLIFHPANLCSLAKLLRTISQFRADVIHFQLGDGVVDFIVFLYCKILKRYPVVATFHDVKPHTGKNMHG